MDEKPVRLRWRPFLLRPDIPPGGVPLNQLLPPGYLEQADARLKQALAQTSLPPLNRQPIVPSTLLAHEAAHLAQERGLGDAFHRACLKAHFAEARNIEDPTVLVEIGASVGLDRAELSQALGNRTYREAVEKEMAEAAAIGVSAVPTFVFGGRVGFSGAQPYEAFLQALDMVDAT